MQMWYTDNDAPPIITVWRPVCPAGYAPLGDIISLGLDPPAAPVRFEQPARCIRLPWQASVRVLIAVMLVWCTLVYANPVLTRCPLTQDIQAEVVQGQWRGAAAAEQLSDGDAS